MRVKKILSILLAVILLAAALYLGICAVATAIHAAGQPYLAAADASYHFLGYSIMAAAYGAAALLAAALGIVLLISSTRRAE